MLLMIPSIISTIKIIWFSKESTFYILMIHINRRDTRMPSRKMGLHLCFHASMSLGLMLNNVSPSSCFPGKLFANKLRNISTGERMCINSPPVNVTSVRTRIQCAGVCNQTPKCLHFNFHEDSKLCEMYWAPGGGSCTSNNDHCTNYVS